MANTRSSASRHAEFDWGVLNAQGRRLADLLVGEMNLSSRVLLLRIALDNVASSNFAPGVQVGFVHRLAEKLMGVKHAVPEQSAGDRDQLLRLIDPRLAQTKTEAAIKEPCKVVSSNSRDAMHELASTPNGLQLIRLPAVIKMIGLSRPTVYRLIKEDKFPKPIKQGRTSAWWKSDVVAYLEQLGSGH